MAGDLVPTSTAQLTNQPAGSVAPYESGPAEAPAGAGGLRRILGVLQRYKWWLALGGVVGAGLGVLVARLIPAKYVADSTVWIETRDRDNSERSSGPIRPGEFLESRQWPELLQSYFVIDTVVHRLTLYLRPGRPADQPLFEGFQFADQFAVGEFTLVVSENGTDYTLYRASDRAARLPVPSFLRRQGLAVERGQVGDSVGRRLGWQWVPSSKRLTPGRELGFEISTPREASQDLLKRLTASVQGQQFIRLTLSERDPERAAMVLNTITEQFVRVATTLKTRKLIEQRDALREQTDFAYQRLKTAELELQNFRIKTVTLPSLTTPVAPGLQMTQPTVIGDFFEKKKRVDELRRDRTAILDLLRRSANGEFTVDAFQTIPSVQNAPDLKQALSQLSVVEAELRAAQLRYTDAHKTVIELKERVASYRTGAIPQLAQALADQLERSVAALDERITNDSRELSTIPERSTTEQRLVREFEAADALFKTLRSRLEAAQLAEASEIPDLRKMDPAVPPRRPAGIPKPLFVLAGLLLGVGVLAAAFLARDLFDRRIQYPEQVTGGSIGLTILGVVPDARRPRQLTQRDLNNQVVEAFREIRLNVVHSFTESGPIALTISSPSPEDGKSFVAANLAMSFAEAGYRTVLVDGDTRRGTLHASFQCDRKPGVIDYLLGRVEASAIVRTTRHPNLSVVPSGERTSQSPELIGSARMKQLFDSLRAEYDVVLFDSPPFSAGVDPYLLGTLTGAMVAVLRSGQTDRQLAEAKLKVIDRLPVQLIGAVLNAVAIRSGNYRYYSYSEGYAAEDEGAPKRVAPGGSATETEARVGD